MGEHLEGLCKLPRVMRGEDLLRSEGGGTTSLLLWPDSALLHLTGWKVVSDLDGHRRILPRHVAENSLGENFICNRCLNDKIVMKAAGSYVCELLVLQSQFFLTSISLPMSFSSCQLAYPLSSLFISNNVKRIIFCILIIVESI